MILVTGGAGYIGSHTVKALQLAGFEPVIFDNFSMGHRDFVGRTPCVEGDLLQPDDLRKVFDTYPIEGVLHFAGKALVEESHRHPELYHAVNVTGGRNLLAAMKAKGVRHFIFSSSCATYGVPETVPIAEDCPQHPINPYGQSKLDFERLLQQAHKSDGVDFLALRYFNAAGADPGGQFGEDHNPESHLIPLVFEAAMGRRPDVRIFGTDYPTPDGTCVRDYLHVNDLADAHVAGLNALIGGRVESQALNLGTGKGYSVREVIDTVRRVIGRDFPVIETDRRPGDPPALIAAANRAKERLGWSAKASGLEHIVSTAWNWHQKRFKP